jgi:AraC-like DNA-binding protein
MRSTDAEYGIELLEARFHGHAYQKHRHDTYAICLTTTGVLAFDYRGSSEISTPGQVVVLHPDEVHDGYAGAAAGFGYRQLYVDPALVFEAVRALSGESRSLPFVRAPVTKSPQLAAAVRSAFESTLEPLAVDSIIVQLAEGLMEADPSCRRLPRPRHLDLAALVRARQFLDAQTTRVVRSSELEAVSGLTRYDLARQFRAMCGTSPYRYSLMRRLDAARERLTRARSLVDVAADAGFADQAHFSRMFKAAFGITPALYRTLRVPEAPADEGQADRTRPAPE